MDQPLGQAFSSCFRHLQESHKPWEALPELFGNERRPARSPLAPRWLRQGPKFVSPGHRQSVENIQAGRPVFPAHSRPVWSTQVSSDIQKYWGWEQKGSRSSTRPPPFSLPSLFHRRKSSMLRRHVPGRNGAPHHLQKPVHWPWGLRRTRLPLDSTTPAGCTR